MPFASVSPTKPASRSSDSLSSGYLPQFGLLGGHNGIGPSSALSIGVAIATYVQAKPTIRINILTARFMVFSLRCETPGRKPRGCGIIQKPAGPSTVFSDAAVEQPRILYLRRWS